MENIERFNRGDFRQLRNYAFQLQTELAVRGIQTEYYLEPIGPRKKRPASYGLFIDIPVISTNPMHSFLFSQDSYLFNIAFEKVGRLYASYMDIVLGNSFETDTLEELVEDSEEWKLSSEFPIMDEAHIMKICRQIATGVVGRSFREIDIRLKPDHEIRYRPSPFLEHDFFVESEDTGFLSNPRSDPPYINSILHLPVETTRYFDNLRHIRHIERFYQTVTSMTQK